MKLLIDIPEHVYEHAKEMSEDSRDEGEAMRAIAKGSQQESCGDAISRQAVFEQIGSWIISGEYGFTNATEYLSKRIKALPSVTPQQRTGRWILAYEQNKEDVENDNYRFICSECQCSDIHAKSIKVPYCWKCGAKMEVEE